MLLVFPLQIFHIAGSYRFSVHWGRINKNVKTLLQMYYISFCPVTKTFKETRTECCKEREIISFENILEKNSTPNILQIY